MNATPLSDKMTGQHMGDRIAAGFLLLLLGVGCVLLWIGIPIGCLWAASQVAGSSAQHFLIALPLTIVAVILFARALFFVNRLYLRVMFARRPLAEDELDEEDQPRWARGPLEPLLVATLVLALLALFVWFFAFAEDPSRQVI